MTDIPEDVMEAARKALGAQGLEPQLVICFDNIVARAILADRAAQAERMARLEEQIGRLRAAISWIEAPFVDETTPTGELKFRVQQCVLDARRALSQEGSEPS